MSDWQTTHRVAAQVRFAHGAVLEGELHLQPGTALHPGAETTLDMLNRPDQFFAMTLPTGETALVAKSQVAVVTCQTADAVVDDPERASVATELTLEVHVVGGHRFRGTTRSELPPLHTRAMDFLNDLTGFFDLTDGDTVQYINRTSVLYVHPLD